MDESARRRGRDTANEAFGNPASVLVGDFLYSRAFQMMAALDSAAVIRVMADATNTIAAGEVMQLMNSGDPDTTEVRYMEVIYRKTARLFEAGAQIAAIVARAPAPVEAALARYGKHLGIAFQLIDDALDYGGDAEELGKNIGDDLAEGKPTLPLIHALKHADGREAEMIRRAIEQGGTEEQGSIRAVIEKHGRTRLHRASSPAAKSKRRWLPSPTCRPRPIAMRSPRSRASPRRATPDRAARHPVTARSRRLLRTRCSPSASESGTRVRWRVRKTTYAGPCPRRASRSRGSGATSAVPPL